jgi:hypothetical protein
MKNSSPAKARAGRDPLRQVAAALELHRAYPAWIDDEQGLPFSATVATPRVRDSLVLRLVDTKRPLLLRHASYAHGAR